MYALEISYKMAIDGGYKNTSPDSDSLGQYFHQLGATVRHHAIRIRDLEFTDDHLINIANLIYYVKKKGYDSLSLSLDHEDSYNAIKDRSYLISSLPEVIAKIQETENGQKILMVSYEENYDSLRDAAFDGMSNDDVEKMFDDIADGKDIDIAIPDEITRKYKTEQSPEEKEKAERNSDQAYKEIAAIIKKLD